MRNAQDLIDEVISRIDSDNRDSVRIADILQALNRGWDDAVDIIVTKQEEFLLKSAKLSGTQLKQDTEGDYYFVVPDDCYQARITAVDYRDDANDRWSKMTLVNAQDARDLESSNLVFPGANQLYYYFLGRKVVFGPTDSIENNATLRVRYVKEPLPLVVPQGRIVNFNLTAGSITVDELGEDVSLLVNNQDNFINIINGQTGEVRGTVQVFNKLGTTTINIRPAPTRSTIFDQDVIGTLPADIALDDYICVAKGSCVPIIDSPVTKMLVEYAVGEIENKLGISDKSLNQAVLDRFETKVKDLSKNRQRRFRVNCTAGWSKRYDRN